MRDLLKALAAGAAIFTVALLATVAVVWFITEMPRAGFIRALLDGAAGGLR